MELFYNLDLQEKKLLENVNAFPKPSKEKVLKAYKLARRYHSGRERDEGGPYILHCLRVTNCLVEELDINDPDVICAALLHDVVEDTQLKLEEIVEKLGNRTGKIVENLTRRKEGETKKNIYQRKYQKFLKLMKMDGDTRAIKVCDWLDAINSWSRIPKNHLAQKKLERWLKEAQTMYLPMAKSLNAEVVKKMESGLARVKT